MTNQSEQSKSSLPRDEFGRGESWHWIVFAVPAVVAALAFLLHAIRPAAGSAPRLVVYCAQDMVYAEPILREFEKRNNCTVRAVFDSEAVKTVGLANRLLAEKSNPRCDVFWGNEELRTRQLAQAGVFRAENGWAAFGYRTRRIAVNTNLLDQAEAPRSLLELTNPVWRGKVALAYPQFGTTSTHLHALRQLWGDAPWELWCRTMAQNKPFLAEGNSTVVKLLGSRKVPVGLTDSDDIHVGQTKGWPLVAQPVTEETLFIPNTVGIVARPEISPLSQALFDYLQSPEVVQKLVDAGALEGFDSREAAAGALRVNWDALLTDLDETSRRLGSIFLR